jgi:PAS domain S-box-containing protein
LPDRATARLLLPGLKVPSSLRSRILALVLALALSMATLAGVALWQAYATAQDQVANQLLATARAITRVVDREFARAEALLQGLALMPSIRDGDFTGFIESGRIAGDILGLPDMALAGPDGRQRASTMASHERLAQGLPAAPEAMRVFRSGRTEISNFSDGSASGQPRILVAVPVRAGRDGPVLYALTLVLPRERLTAALLEQQIPEGWAASVSDRALTLVARNRAEEIWVGQSTPEAVATRMGAQAEGLIPDSQNMEGEQVLIAFSVAPFSGYRVAIGASQASFAALRWAAMLRLASVVVPIVGLGAALALLLAHSLAQSLRGLAQPNAALPELREMAELSTALAAERAARDIAEAALRDRSAWLEAAQQAGEVGVWAWDATNDLARWSDGMAALLGMAGGASVAHAYRHLRRRVLPEDRAGLDAAIAGILAQAEPPAVEFRLLRPDGTLRWLRAQASLLPVSPDGARLVLGAFIDITTRRALEQDREALLAQKEFLAGEIHHRVKNSLQLVLSLLLLQARRASPEAAMQLREAAGRVSTVAAVHRRLYEDEAPDGGDAGRYMAGLVEDLRRSLADHSAGRDILLVAEPGLRPGLERLAPLGIVATELMTNALKYGGGTVTLRLHRAAEELELAVEDEGPGFPMDFNPNASRGLGMRVATTLTRQAGGRLDVDRSAKGGRVVLRVPLAVA